MDMFIVLNVVMVSEVYTIVKIRHFKYWQFIVWQKTSF